MNYAGRLGDSIMTVSIVITNLHNRLIKVKHIIMNCIGKWALY